MPAEKDSKTNGHNPAVEELPQEAPPAAQQPVKIVQQPANVVLAHDPEDRELIRQLIRPHTPFIAYVIVVGFFGVFLAHMWTTANDKARVDNNMEAERLRAEQEREKLRLLLKEQTEQTAAEVKRFMSVLTDERVAAATAKSLEVQLAQLHGTLEETKKHLTERKGEIKYCNEKVESLQYQLSKKTCVLF